MNIWQWFIVGAISLVGLIFLIWQLSIPTQYLPRIAFILMFPSAVLLVFFFKSKKTFTDEFDEAEQYARKYVEKEAGTQATYLEAKGSTRNFKDTNFYAFAIYRSQGMRTLMPYLVVLKKGFTGFNIFLKNENPTDKLLDDFFSTDAKWNTIRGILIGAPVSIDEEVYRKPKEKEKEIRIETKTKEDKEKGEVGLK